MCGPFEDFKRDPEAEKQPGHADLSRGAPVVPRDAPDRDRYLAYLRDNGRMSIEAWRANGSPSDVFNSSGEKWIPGWNFFAANNAYAADRERAKTWQPPPPTPPTLGDENVRAAAERAMLMQRGGSRRESFLTEPYTGAKKKNTLLGGG